MSRKEIEKLIEELESPELKAERRDEIIRILKETKEGREALKRFEKLEKLLLDIPRVKPPLELESQILKSTIYSKKRRPLIFRKFAPVMVALLMVFIGTFIFVTKSRLTANAIYVNLLSPEDRAAIFRDDFVILGAIYPATPDFDVKFYLDGRLITGRILKGKGYFILSYPEIEPGYHNLRVIVNISGAKLKREFERLVYVADSSSGGNEKG